MPWPIDALPYPFELGFMQRALVASVVIGIVIYLSFRFEWKYAVAGIIAVAAYYLLGRRRWLVPRGDSAAWEPHIVDIHRRGPCIYAAH